MTLRRRLSLAFVLAALLPAVLVAALHSWNYLRNAEEVIESQTLVLVRQTTRALDEVVQTAARDLHGLAAAGLLVSATPSALSPRLMAWTYAHPYFRDIYWVSPQGVVLAATDLAAPGQAMTALRDELIDELATTLREPAGILHLSDYDDRPAMHTSGVHRRDTAVHSLQLLLRVDTARGEPAGVLVAELSSQPVVAELEALQRNLPGRRPVLLLNHDGTLLMSSDPDAALFHPHALAARLPAGTDTADKDVVQFETALDGKLLEVTVAETAGLGPAHAARWHVVATQLEYLIRAPLQRTLLETGGVLAALLGVGAALSMWLTGVLLRPVDALATVARRLAAGDYATRAIAADDDEIGHLGQAFNHLAATIEHDSAELHEANQILNARILDRNIALAQLEINNRHNRLLTECTGLLQTAESIAEAGDILHRFLAALFAPHSGAVYLIKDSRNYLDLHTRWGETALATSFELSGCWALRRGQPYQVDHATDALICAHVGTLPDDQDYLCLPLMAQGETLGLLHLRCATAVPDSRDRPVLLEHAQQVAEQLALAIANLKLRAQLREQSIRDLLTGLHNRRYLEEALAGALARAEREQVPLAVFMLDVDHFKQFNDSCGHEAGDAVLQALGRALREAARAGDITCRFGGEEFTAVLPKANLAQARDWAARLLERVRRLEVKTGGRVLPGITVSVGMALYPEHGADPETLIQTADMALYGAKHAGRDRLVVFGDETGKAAAKGGTS